jgi:low affinity Fe/Cu permease
MDKKFHAIHSREPRPGPADLNGICANMEFNAMANSALSARPADAQAARSVKSAGQGRSGSRLSKYFSDFSHLVAHAAGTPAAFLLAVLTILVWAVSGPLFGYSDTWQLVINTGTTIVTFLMVFLIQSTQNRDTMALQLKLSELIIAMKGAKDSVATIEDLSEEELEQLHRELSERMQVARDAHDGKHVKRNRP